MSENITIEGLIRNAIESRMLDVHTCVPVIVHKVGANTVDITVAIKRVKKDQEEFTVPVIPDVPVLFFGSGGLSIAHAISVGDEGIAVFCERDISSFIESGKVLRPTILRKHEYSDALFIPTSLSNSNRAAIPSAGIEITGDVKVIGNIESTGEVTAIADGASVSLSTHQHPSAPTGSPSSPTPGT